jgi:hypothetical protein
VMEREELKRAATIALCIVATGFVLTGLSVVSMRMAYHRAYSEIASSCDRVSLVVVGRSRYFCAPVARVELADRAAGAGQRAGQGAGFGPAPEPEPTQSTGRIRRGGTSL